MARTNLKEKKSQSKANLKVVDERAIKKAVVVREKLIKNNRRIDLFLKVDKKEIPIEVKLYAADQDKQCADYFEYAVDSPSEYLTLDGHEPIQESKGNLTRLQIDPLPQWKPMK